MSKFYTSADDRRQLPFINLKDYGLPSVEAVVPTAQVLQVHNLALAETISEAEDLLTELSEFIPAIASYLLEGLGPFSLYKTPHYADLVFYQGPNATKCMRLLYPGVSSIWRSVSDSLTESLNPMLQSSAADDGSLAFISLGGSRLYGTHTPESDFDFRAVYRLPQERFLDLNPPKEDQLTKEITYEHDKQKIEIVAHEVGKFARLLLKGNPTMVEMATLTKSLTEYEKATEYCLWDTFWKSLDSFAADFVSQTTCRQYIGYITGQMSRLKKGQKLHTGNSGNYNTKWAYHIVRLSWDLNCLLDGYLPQVRYKNKDADYLRAVRNEEVPQEEILKQANKIIEKADSGALAKLPKENPEEKVRDWLREYRKIS